MEITSKPIKLDEVDREIIRLEMEKLSLKNDTDKASKERLGKLEAELESLKQKQKDLSEHWEYEKSLMARIRSIKEEVGACVIFCVLIVSCSLLMFLQLHHVISNYLSTSWYRLTELTWRLNPLRGNMI